MMVVLTFARDPDVTVPHSIKHCGLQDFSLYIRVHGQVSRTLLIQHQGRLVSQLPDVHLGDLLQQGNHRFLLRTDKPLALADVSANKTARLLVDGSVRCLLRLFGEKSLH